MLATPSELLDQVPPIVADDSVDVSPIQISVFPLIGEMIGLALTTILPVALIFPQPPIKGME